MKKKVALIGAVGSLVPCVSAFAESGSGTANAAVTSAMTGIANDMVATGTAMIPIALTVVGIAVVVVFGKRIFGKVSGTGRP